MNILTSFGRKHLEGHKELTASKDVVRFDPKEVHIFAVGNKGEDLKEALAVGAKVKCGTVLGIRPDFNIPVVSSVSGTISKIEMRFNPVLGRPTKCFVIENDQKYERELLKPLKADPSLAELIEAMRQGGIIGLGGAGFPTYVKYSTDKKIEEILINDVECEPYLTTDYVATKLQIEKVIKAAEVLVKATKANKATIAIKKTKTELIALVKEKLQGHDKVVLKTVSDVYPMGYERTLVQAVYNKKYDKLPIEAGVIVNNFQTISSIYDLIFEGKRPDLRIYTFSGNGLKNPANVEAPYGTLLHEINEFLGYAAEEVIIVYGGPMTGKTLRTAEVPLLLNASGVIVYDEKKFLKTIKSDACLRCGSCVDHCPANLQPVLIYDALKIKNYEKAMQLGITDCLECGLCSACCPSHINLAAAIAKDKMIARLKAPQVKMQ